MSCGPVQMVQRSNPPLPPVVWWVWLYIYMCDICIFIYIYVPFVIYENYQPPYGVVLWYVPLPPCGVVGVVIYIYILYILCIYILHTYIYIIYVCVLHACINVYVYLLSR